MYDKFIVIFHIKTDKCTLMLLMPLYLHCVILTCYGPQRAIFREYNWYISTARSTKYVPDV